MGPHARPDVPRGRPRGEMGPARRLLVHGLRPYRHGEADRAPCEVRACEATGSSGASPYRSYGLLMADDPLWNRWCYRHGVRFEAASHATAYHGGATVHRCPHCVEESRAKVLELRRTYDGRPWISQARQVVTPAVMMPD